MKAFSGGFCALALVLSAEQAVAASFRTQQIAILGSTQVSATGINDEGTIIGLVELQPNSSTTAFVSQAGSVALLGNYLPTAVNRHNAVTGISLNGDTGFLWQNGAFVANVDFPLGALDGSRLAPTINASGRFAYSSAGDNSVVGYVGRPSHFRALHGLSTSFAIINSINDSGVISGIERATIAGQETQVAFVGKSGFFDLLVPPAGGYATGGFVNKAGQVAYASQNAGYVYMAGHTTSFIPPAGGLNFSVQAINNSGRIVGTYFDTSQNPYVQRAYLYNGNVLTPFGSYNEQDVVQIALADNGAMIVSDQQLYQQTMSSYLVRCSGSGC